MTLGRGAKNVVYQAMGHPELMSAPAKKSSSKKGAKMPKEEVKETTKKKYA